MSALALLAGLLLAVLFWGGIVLACAVIAWIILTAPWGE